LTGEAATAAGEAKAPDAYGDPYEDYPEDEASTELTATKILEIATACKDYGNKAFKAGDIQVGLDKYQKGLRYLNEEPELKDAPEGTAAKLNSIRFSLNSNSALLSIKLESWTDAEQSAAAALAVPGISDAEKGKALYRRGFALVRMKDEDGALAALEQAKKLVPSDAAITKELDTVKKQAAARAAKEKAAYKKFFS
jgi:peptidyl-prolyl isomerase D